MYIDVAIFQTDLIVKIPLAINTRPLNSHVHSSFIKSETWPFIANKLDIIN